MDCSLYVTAVPHQWHIVDEPVEHILGGFSRIGQRGEVEAQLGGQLAQEGPAEAGVVGVTGIVGVTGDAGVVGVVGAAHLVSAPGISESW